MYYIPISFPNCSIGISLFVVLRQAYALLNTYYISNESSAWLTVIYYDSVGLVLWS